MEMDVNSLPCLLFSYSDSGIILDVNHQLCERLGYSEEELIGNKVETIFTVATKIFQQTHLFPLLKMQGFAEEVFVDLKTRTGNELPVLINAKRVENGEGIQNIHLGILVPNRQKFEQELINARKTAEAALLEKRDLVKVRSELQHHIERLEASIHIVNKQNEELRQFNKVVTHDIQEPLRKLFLFTNMLDKDHDQIVQLKLSKRIQSVAWEMQLIISGLQQYIWLTEASVQLEKIDLNEIIAKVEQQLRLEYPGVNFKLLSSALPVISADRKQIEMLFYNIIENALVFKKPDVDPVIEVSAVSLSQNIFKNIKDKYKYEEMMRIEVSDNGRGFDDRFKQQVFELFKGLHPDSKKGIGLSLAKKIVENHNGSINIRSQVNVGTTLSILLPYKQITNES